LSWVEPEAGFAPRQTQTVSDKVNVMSLSRLIKQALGATVLAGALLASAPTAANAAVFVSVGIAPPAIPVYTQPLCPGDGYIWTPGYWAWNGASYAWVDGAWVLAPYTGALWTPGYWGWGGGVYLWHAGYWGRTVGYYGGINYGFGYFGTGFYGGYWGGGHFFYNRAYGHFGPGFRGGFYNRPVAGFRDGRPGGASFTNHPGNLAGNHGSFNGGRENVAANRAGAGGFNNANRGGAPASSQARQSSNSSTNRGGFNSANSAHAGSAPAAAAHGGGAVSHGGGGGGSHGGGHR
jgi:hypothetical protein